LVQAVESVFALLADLDEAGLAQHGQVVRDRRLGDLKLLDDVADREPLAAAELHNFLAGLVGQGFCEFEGGGVCHIDEFLWVII